MLTCFRYMLRAHKSETHTTKHLTVCITGVLRAHRIKRHVLSCTAIKMVVCRRPHHTLQGPSSTHQLIAALPTWLRPLNGHTGRVHGNTKHNHPALVLIRKHRQQVSLSAHARIVATAFCDRPVNADKDCCMKLVARSPILCTVRPC